jgi:hypothetical protein
MREAAYLLIVLIGFAIVGTIDADTTEALLAEHAPVTVATLEE